MQVRSRFVLLSGAVDGPRLCDLAVQADVREHRFPAVGGRVGDEEVEVKAGGLLNRDGTALDPQFYQTGANGRITANGGDKDDHLAAGGPSQTENVAGDQPLSGSDVLLC